MSEIIDIDALIPEDRTIKFDGVEIKVKPPQVKNVARVGSLGQKLQNSDQYTDAEIDAIVVNLQNQIVECIPELAGKTLLPPQLLVLTRIISDMGMPDEAQELAKRGISGDGLKKAQQS